MEIPARVRRQKFSFAQESKPWSILVVIVKWHHLANGLLTGYFHDKKIELTKITRENAWEEKAFETAYLSSKFDKK